MNVKIIRLLIKDSILNTLVFKGSLLVKIVTVLLSELSSIYIMFILVNRFHEIGKLSSGEFVFMFFFAHISYSICILFFNNLRRLGKMIQMGTFDKMRILPVNTLFYISFYDFDISCIAEVVTSVVLFIIFRNVYGVDWSFKMAVYICLLLLCSILILSSILIILSSFAFVIIDWKPLDNMFGAFKEMLWYPLNIYNGIVRIILYSVIPLAYIVEVPTKLIFKQGDFYINNYAIVLPYLAISTICFICCYKLWYFQASKYQSVG